MNIKIDMSEVEAGMKKFKAKAQKAAEQAMKEVVVDIANDVIKIHPWKTRTGNNSRSIAYGVGKTQVREGMPEPGKEYSPLEPPVGKLQGTIYSTSGYGGYLETGTVYMPAFPYFKPALDRNLPKFMEKMRALLKW